jgi:hypothetical protein
MPGKSGSESNSQTERESSILNTAPGSMTDAEKRIFAWRRWYGIGPDGREVEEWKQKEIAAHLGVSERTVRRWVKEEPAPIFQGLSRERRLLLYSMIVGERFERAEEYLTLLDLEGRLSKGRNGSPVKSPGFEKGESDSRNWTAGTPGMIPEESAGPDSEAPPFGELSEDFNPW